MKKVLLISWYYPLPEMDGGSMRTMHFVRFLKKYGSIDIISATESLENKEEGNFFSTIYNLKKKEYPETYLGRFLILLRRVPFPIREYDKAIFHQFLNLIETNNYDYIFVRTLLSTSGLFNLPLKYKNRIIVDVDDIISGSLYGSFFNDNVGMFRRMLRNINYKLLINYEKKLLNFGAITFCRELDRKKFEQTKNKNLFIVPNIYENKLFDRYDFGNGYANENTLLFVGTLQYFPNIEGLRWFIKTIFSEFKKIFSDARLVIVGRYPDEEIKNLCEKTDGVVLHANAPDVREYYRGCRAVVVPLLNGGGTRIKILEAALAQRPVLSTPMGVEGLDLIDGRDLLLFNNSMEFCSKYKELFQKNKYEGLVDSAKRIVQAKYSKDAFEESIKNVIEYVDCLTKPRST